MADLATLGAPVNRADLLKKLRLMRGQIGAILSHAELDVFMAELDDRRCATCRWAEAAWKSGHGYPSAALMERYPLACTKSAMSGGEPEDPSTLAFTMDGSEYRGELLVTPTFGCVMWEAKA